MTKENTTSSEFAGETGRAAAVENKSNTRREERLWSAVVTGEKNPIAHYSPLKPRHTSSPAKKQSEDSTDAPVSVLHTHLVSPPPGTKVHLKQSKRQHHQTSVNTADSAIRKAVTSIACHGKPPPLSLTTLGMRSESVDSQQPDSSFNSGFVIAKTVDHRSLTITVDRPPGKSITTASRSVTSQAFDDANESVAINAGSDGATTPAGSASGELNIVVLGAPKFGPVQAQAIDLVQLNRMDQGELVVACNAATTTETIGKALRATETA